ncbi:phage integrase SAM-like domain-containing protein [Flavobacterium sp. FlaQc-50]|uniref:phage integrase SAM-like domain-containing protein n=1 Tax=unclassified Flavobacterium TaxID=196869 RepID=UPI0037564F91
MATVKYRIVGKKNPSEIRLRYLSGRAIDIDAGIKVSVNPDFWDQKNQKIKNVIAVPDRDKINRKLVELKLHVESAANLDFMEGEILNKIWLEKSIAKFYKRPSGELKKVVDLHKIYLSDFADWWMKEKAPKFKVAANKYMSTETIQHYSILNDQVKLFEGKDKIRFIQINELLLDKFSEFLSGKGYASKTAKRMVGRFKFFCGRAEAENIVIDQSYKNRVFVEQSTVDYKEPYFDEFEISKIYAHDFSKNSVLDNARDNLIIGLWTGLRVSDFLSKLKIDNFDDDYIEIQTEKTKTFVSIPIHWMIKEILKKREGKLPEKVSDQKFNKHIKKIAEVLEFNKMMMGGVMKIDPNTDIKRKVVDLYPKHELITSHICRRSFATNTFGTVSNATLMSICGWKSEEQMLDYIKKTNREHAEVLKKVWDNKYLKEAN